LKWWDKVKDNVSGMEHVPVTVLANKVDASVGSQIPPLRLADMLERDHVSHAFTSAWTGAGVQAAFDDIVGRVKLEIPVPLRYRHEEATFIRRRELEALERSRGGCC